MKASSRRKSIQLRREGKSIKEIARKIGVSQGSVSRWCSGILLSIDQRNKLEKRRREAGLRALAPWIKRNQELKQNDILKQKQKGREDVGRMIKRDLFLLGLGLYWGEGYKRGSQELGFTNSDPKIIRVILAWFKTHYDVPTDRIIARLTINERYSSQTKRLKEMWARDTGIALSQFGKPTFISGYHSSTFHARTYRGTLRIKVRRGTSLRRRILASISEISNQIALKSRKTDA